MSYDKPTEAAAVADIALAGVQPIFKQPADHGTVAPLAVFPRSEKIESLEKYLPNPVRRRAKVQLLDYQSFIAYVCAHKEPGTHLFAVLTPAGGQFVAIIDYHEAVNGGAATAKPQWGEHIVVLDLQHSPEWLNWTGKSGRPMDQLTMANFLEENRLDIKVPDAATVIEIAHTFEATQGVQFKSAIRQQSGDRTLGYDVQTGAKAGQKGELSIPEKIGLCLPVFTNGVEYEMDAFFRYNIGDGSLKLRYELVRPHKFIELALAETRNAIAEQTKLTVHAGTAGVRC